VLILLLSGSNAFGQAGHYWFERDLQVQLERGMMADGLRDHLAIKPLAIRDIPAGLLVHDSSLVFQKYTSNFWKMPGENEWHLAFTPLFSAGLGYGSQGGGINNIAPGLAVNLQYGKHWSFYGDFVGGAYLGPAYVRNFTAIYNVLPGIGEDYSTDGTPTFIMPTARLSYAPSEYFQFELGYGKNFFGQGYRSMLLSDVAFNYPYLKIETDVWHIKYVNLYSWQEGTNPAGANPTTFERKYTATHYLDWAVSPQFNIGLFETIVWQGQDTLSDRGFDPNYLNPIIFYRTVEYSIGSPDNAMMGIDLSYKVNKQWMIYGQLLLDEFLLNELRDRSGWWANKWGTQLGVKAYDPFGKKGLFIQAEFNVARPFTYTHGSVLQNYAHYNQPLAHILGTNFYEGLLHGYYEKGDWYGSASFMYAAYGRDPDTLNLGGDIFKSYENPSKQYDNTIGQGIATHLYYQKLSVGMVLNRDVNLRVGIDYIFRHQNTDGQPDFISNIVGVHISTQISNFYQDF
jgi:hypothetical protein